MIVITAIILLLIAVSFSYLSFVFYKKHKRLSDKGYTEGSSLFYIGSLVSSCIVLVSFLFLTKVVGHIFDHSGKEFHPKQLISYETKEEDLEFDSSNMILGDDIITTKDKYEQSRNETRSDVDVLIGRK